jgi:Caspase domain
LQTTTATSLCTFETDPVSVAHLNIAKPIVAQHPRKETLPMARLKLTLITAFVASLPFALGIGSATTADAQTKRSRNAPAAAPENANTAPRALAKIYRRPLMRVARLQFCLLGLGRFEGRTSGRLTPATLKALAAFRNDNQLKTDADVEKDWALHAVLWRECRELWTKAGGTLDAAGLPVRAIANRVTAAAEASAQPTVATAFAAIASPPTPPTPPTPAPAPVPAAPAAAVPPVKTASSLPEPAMRRFCLPPDLRDILVRAHGARRDISECELPCLPQPAELAAEDARFYERRWNMSFCKTCVPFSSQLSLDEIMRIEQAGNITLCPEPRRLTRTKLEAPGRVTTDTLRGVRSLFRRDVKPLDTHNNIAVLIGNANYRDGLKPKPSAERDLVAMQALLVERLGYRPGRIIELKDAARADIDGVFGRPGNSKGLLSDRLKEALRDGPGTSVFVYISGLGSLSGEDGEAFLLPIDANARRESAAGIALEPIYQNLTRMGASAVTVVLEVDFAADPAAPMVAPNVPSSKTSILPKFAMRGLTAFTAADKDQRPLEDPEFGLGLFTRHLIAGLSGAADSPPLGNGDGSVDSSEAFVYAAYRTNLSARKAFGMLQRPTISQGRPITVGRVGAPVRP